MVANKIYEKTYSLLISQYMYDRFKKLGIPVTLTRDSDTTLSPSDRTKRVLDAYENQDDMIVISNHLNAGEDNRLLITEVDDIIVI